jgi:hypothetical protein
MGKNRTDRTRPRRRAADPAAPSLHQVRQPRCGCDRERHCQPQAKKLSLPKPLQIIQRSEQKFPPPLPLPLPLTLIERWFHEQHVFRLLFQITVPVVEARLLDQVEYILPQKRGVLLDLLQRLLCEAERVGAVSI